MKRKKKVWLNWFKTINKLGKSKQQERIEHITSNCYVFSVFIFLCVLDLQAVYDKICLVVTSLWFWHTVQWRNSDVIDYFTIFTMNEWMNAYIKRMKTSTPEGRDRSAMWRGGGWGGEGGGRGDTHAHPHTNEGGKGGGSHTTLTIPHSSNNSFIQTRTNHATFSTDWRHSISITSRYVITEEMNQN